MASAKIRLNNCPVMSVYEETLHKAARSPHCVLSRNMDNTVKHYSMFINRFKLHYQVPTTRFNSLFKSLFTLAIVRKG